MKARLVGKDISKASHLSAAAISRGRPGFDSPPGRILSHIHPTGSVTAMVSGMGRRSVSRCLSQKRHQHKILNLEIGETDSRIQGVVRPKTMNDRREQSLHGPFFFWEASTYQGVIRN
ncbi:hypothetical protein AVEN_160685-1 [Araneus ventricosus]|uniref:Uncharacterized protein n=1 Tax=Araneus ventricosus TaxID=182803 RepID=A0A4Y2PFQ2_ARAVE|nr:hypothetical protein AVEN_14260-1 [Araneus ventricosus]GBN50164.1 hypothetical protein AVEN_160685-1 [Araneus ventricosus]